ncbi:MAG: class I SAM-dependent methyltransferase [Candidatus Hodarchaeota archaeon]
MSKKYHENFEIFTGRPSSFIRQDLRLRYAALLRRWNGFYVESEFAWGFDPDEDLEFFISSIPTGSRVLDFGCGTGRNALYLAEIGMKVTAIDFSPVAIQQAEALMRKRGVSGVELLCTDGIPLGGTFDVVICLGVLHGHLRNEAALIAKGLQKALRTGGYLLVKTWSREDAEYGQGKSCEEGTFWHRLGFWVHYFEKGELLSLFLEIEPISVYRSIETEYHGGKHQHTAWVLWGRKG